MDARRPFRRSERGQSLVLLALAMIGMLGFAGLAIDGGILFTDRRQAQNAADAAALAGALAYLNGGDLYSAAYARAADNGYDNNQTSNWVYVYHPPIDGPYAGNPQYIQVRIVSRVDSVFIHFVYGGVLENTVTAVARAKPPTVKPLLDGHALVGLAKTGCSVVWSHGNADTTITGGGVFVNSSDPNCAFVANGNNTLTVNGGGINVVGGWEIGNNATVTPYPTGGAEQVDAPDIPPPSCSGNAVRDEASQTFTPGYTNNFNFNNGNWTLQPGVYCVDGGFRVNGGASLTGQDVTIYIMSGDVTWNGGATINLDAPDDGPYAGMLLYQDPNNDERATINGDSNSHFTGTIYIPGAEVQINGTGASDGFHAQVIGLRVDMSGTSDLNIIYNAAENYQVREPARVELTE